ncbi:MAG TPA: choice-of-anchor tandem repeat GloVer-containing protein [Candidatus Acidoferrum sp.]|nr:choice-of-anchor tandem repeat GloVer-containing protein [Candidatus Acidoferrum sp.]
MSIRMHLTFTIAVSLTLALRVLAQAQTYTESVIYSFTGATGDEPVASGVVRDSAGNFYGTTYVGGAFDYGTVFMVDISGNETVLHSFGQEPLDGRQPVAGLVMDGSGHLFGTTYYGGVRNRVCYQGCGIVFEIDGAGHMKTLHRFVGGADGALPAGALVTDREGNLYGTTQMGGVGRSGTVFEIDKHGVEKVLYSFIGYPDGFGPEAGLIIDSEGNLYGTTSSGGSNNSGSVFKLEPGGRETVLHSFGPQSSNADGYDPVAPLLRTPNGDLYGTTLLGGPANGGSVFVVHANGNEAVLHFFVGTDGGYPESSLIRDAQGNLFGTTLQGGPAGNLGGTLFEITEQGVFSLLFTFTGLPGAGDPAGPLLLDASGTIYGTSGTGGTANYGTLYMLTP